jgi:ubiquinol-cytochrome c reductase cytochrome c1 subunit
MMRAALLGLVAFLAVCAPSAQAEDTLAPLHFQSDGVFGSYDIAALQRGFLVYQTSCAACHSLNALHYRDLEGLGLTPDQVAGIASAVKLGDGSPATLDDVFRDPAPKPASFGGAVPPDLSTIVGARPGGIDYIYRYLTGFTATPQDVTLLPAHVFNAAYPGNQTAMPAPLKGKDVAYADGVSATVPQEAADVAAFLAWANDPNLNARHEIGLRAVMFLVALTILAIATKRRIWREAT